MRTTALAAPAVGAALILSLGACGGAAPEEAAEAASYSSLDDLVAAFCTLLVIAAWSRLWN